MPLGLARGHEWRGDSVWQAGHQSLDFADLAIFDSKRLCDVHTERPLGRCRHLMSSLARRIYPGNVAGVVEHEKSEDHLPLLIDHQKTPRRNLLDVVEDLRVE